MIMETAPSQIAPYIFDGGSITLRTQNKSQSSDKPLYYIFISRVHKSNRALKFSVAEAIHPYGSRQMKFLHFSFQPWVDMCYIINYLS